MRKEIENENLTEVSGGKYAINNQNMLFFSSTTDSFQITGSRYAAMEIMDGMIGQYPSEQEYDAACISALKSAGLIS